MDWLEEWGVYEKVEISDKTVSVWRGLLKAFITLRLKARMWLMPMKEIIMLFRVVSILSYILSVDVSKATIQAWDSLGVYIHRLKGENSLSFATSNCLPIQWTG